LLAPVPAPLGLVALPPPQGDGCISVGLPDWLETKCNCGRLFPRVKSPKYSKRYFFCARTVMNIMVGLVKCQAFKDGGLLLYGSIS
jgi:hypothetical protein